MPELTSEQLLSFVPAVSALCRAECLQLLSLDSTNLAPSHWLLIAKAIRERYDRYDGFVISHGTDTMAYTAAALSYLIQGARKPIILTGAQKQRQGHSGHPRLQNAHKELRGLLQHQLSVSGCFAGRLHSAVYRKRLPARAGLL